MSCPVPWSALYSERFDDHLDSADSCCDPYSCTQTNFRSEVDSLRKRSQKLRRSRNRFDPRYSDKKQRRYGELIIRRNVHFVSARLGFVHTVPRRKRRHSVARYEHRMKAMSSTITVGAQLLLASTCNASISLVEYFD